MTEYLTVKELADLLRLKERKVYDLAASGQVPCSRATGKLLFPADDIRDWLKATTSGATTTRPPVVLGSHDPLLDWALRESRSGLATIFDSSLDGLARFAGGEGVAAGLHVHEPDGWNTHTARQMANQDVALVRWATRQRGLVMRPETADHVDAMGDLIGQRIAPRQPQAGAEILFRRLVADAGIALEELTFAPPSRSEQDAVLAVAEGEADITFGLHAVAKPYGLAFKQVIAEEFDLLLCRRAWFAPPMQSLFAFARSDVFAEKAARFGGYDTARLGEVKWNS